MQQINLYVPELRPRREWLSATDSVYACVAFLAILVLIYVSELGALQRIEQKVAALQAQEQRLQTTVTELKQKPPSNRKAELEQEIASLREAITNRQQIEALLSGRNLGNKEGFSPFFAAISGAIPDTLSLHAFDLKKAGQLANFQGVSKSAHAVPLFLQQLQHSEAFAKSVFGPLRIEEQGQYLAFKVGAEEDLAAEMLNP